MKKSFSVLLVAAMVILGSCGTSKKANVNSDSISLNDELKDRNRANISLLQRITQMRGIVLHNNLPVINKTANSFASAGNQEPLYVLNNQVIGYGSQRSNGVIKIVSY